jgi:hypothetical protein
MDQIKNKFSEKVLPQLAEMKEFLKQNGDHTLGTYNVDAVVSGMKGMIGLLTET